MAVQTVTNREIFLKDPTKTSIPNDGVAKVVDPRTEQEWAVLRYELESFVCEGEYRDGLERVLSSYLRYINQPTQPAAWVSGFYGSGKSHLVRVLEYLWRDVELPDGARARGLAHLPQDIQAQFRELTTIGRREGGLWSAAGTLSAGAGKSVRLALLSIVFQSAGLPAQYPLASFVMWLREAGYYDSVKAGVEASGKEFDKELANLYVSPHIAQSVLDAYPGFASSPADARSLFRAQFANPDDVSDADLLQKMEQVLALQSEKPGKLPCTLLVFDELQQFIGDDSSRTLQVQEVVEACCSRFGSRLLFVGTGQAALQAAPALQKLQGRFTVRVTLSDTDVERVVREVVLRKRPERVPQLEDVLRATSGEIDRQLVGTKIGPSMADRESLVPDYPLLPVRRRFWERVLRAVDTAGAAGQLRTQLRIVHDAARDVADSRLGTVVAGDYIFEQIKSDMLHSGVLLRDTATTIDEQKKEGSDGELRARLCATIFLIGKLPTEGPSATGIRATADALADLLAQDLSAGSAELRQRIPTVLQSLVDSGTLMLVGDEYRLQTREGTEWEQDFRSRFTRIRADDARVASDRSTALRAAVSDALKGITVVQGTTKTPRRFELHYAAEMPSTETAAVPVWVRDEWSVSEPVVRGEAQAAGVASPVVFTFLPRHDPDALRDALANQAAAQECLAARPTSVTPEGIEARTAMESRLKVEQGRVKVLIAAILSNARVFQGGGNPITEGTLQASVKIAIEAALARLFPRFDTADVNGWNTVIKRAQQGALDALSAVGYSGDVESHPVCKEIRDFVGGAGKRGTEVRKRFQGEPCGWPQDAIDGALLALVAAGLVRASKNGQPVTVKQLDQSQIGVTDFASEGVVITAKQRIDLRAFFAAIGLNCRAGEEAEAAVRVLQRLADAARAAGGEPPLPERPSAGTVEDLQALAGNEQLMAIWQQREQLQADYKSWTRAQALIIERRPRWEALEKLLARSGGLRNASEIGFAVQAIRAQRSLLAEPDPMTPLLTVLAAELRSALQERRRQLVKAREHELANLQATEEWSQISENDRKRVLRDNNLEEIPELRVGTDEDLIKELETTPLAEWNEKAMAMAAWVARAREEAVKLLTPQAIRVDLPSVTLKTPQEVDTYLATLREMILAHVNAGKPVIL